MAFKRPSPNESLYYEGMPVPMTDPLIELTGAIASHLSQVSEPEAAIQDAVGHLLQSARHARRQAFSAASHGYAALVARAVELGRNACVAGIATHLLPVHGSMPWVYHYPHAVDDDRSTRIAFAELIGPDGPLLAPDCRVGFTVMAPDTTYPMHCHPAVELYLVVAGNARWQTPSRDRMVPPGEFVLHRSNEPHAMRTYDEPLLALWGWTGEIDAPAAYLP
jgi:quercetin dioxygenase-like cupin family protein